jgi:lambda repressor-like predicted transcriptional regulator
MNNENRRGRTKDAARTVLSRSPMNPHEHIAAAVAVKLSLWPQRLANPQAYRILSILPVRFFSNKHELALLPLAFR